MKFHDVTALFGVVQAWAKGRLVIHLDDSQEKMLRQESDQKPRKEVGRHPLLLPRLASRTTGYALVFSLLLGAAATETAWAIAMPAGSTVWMEFHGHACAGSPTTVDCLGSNQPGPNPPNGIPLTTFGALPSATETGFAEALPDRVRSYVGGYGGQFMYVSMLDTYTVHGTAAGPFTITAHLEASGTLDSLWVVDSHRLFMARVNVEIGTFNPATVEFNEPDRVVPFDESLNSATYGPTSYLESSSPFSQPVSVATSYTRSVSVGDVFDLAYGVNSSTVIGYVDLLNTAHIWFDLPQGVDLTSALGGTFGAPVSTPVPEPSTAWLFGLGLLGLIGVAGRKMRHRGR